MNYYIMHPGRLIKYFIPPILYLPIRIIRGLIRHPNTYLANVKSYQKKHRCLVVMGNGPSLNKSLEKYGTQLRDYYDVMAVNGFSSVPYFEQIKPNMYVLADPIYFSSKQEVGAYERKKLTALEKDFNDKVNWPVALFIPINGKDSELIKNISQNVNVSVHCYNYYDHIDTTSKALKFFGWDHNLIGLTAQNVLNTCVNLGIILRYEEIYIIGADTNWHENIRVEQDTNRLYTVKKYFYGEEKVYIYEDVTETRIVKLHEELTNIANAHSNYWLLREYADDCNVKIYNASEYSCIDAFDRKGIPTPTPTADDKKAT